MNYRNFTRVDISEFASVKYGERIFFGNVKNISLQGLYVKTHEEIPLNIPVEVTVYQSPNISIRLLANVVRQDLSGVGIQIKEMDTNSFVKLKNVIEEKCDDLEFILHETIKVASCIR
jgi:hypothetical protein